MLYAVALGVACGILFHGHVQGLAAVRFRWAGLALAGLVIQIALFSAPVEQAIGNAGAPVYVASSVLVFVAVMRNAGLPGLPIVALGAGSNLAAIVANGGWMPANPAALAALGESVGQGYSNSRVFESPALAPLTDVMALPGWLPFANVFSVGDMLIGIGVFMAIVVTMRRVPVANRKPAAPTERAIHQVSSSKRRWPVHHGTSALW